MVVTKRQTVEIRLEPAELQKVVMHLPRDQWQPAILGQRQFFLRLAGLPENFQLASYPSHRSRLRRRSIEQIGELFFSGDVIIYVLIGREDRVLIPDASGRIYAVHDPDVSSGIEVGAIGRDPDQVDMKLKDFVAAFQSAIREALDGRRVRHMVFDWKEKVPGRDRLERLMRAENDEDTGPTSSSPNMSLDHIAGATVLAETSVRELAIFISEAVFARQKELISRAKKQDEMKDLLEKLQRGGIVSTEYLLECRRHGTRLSRFANLADLEDPKIGSLKCASCGAEFRDEMLHEGYSLSQLGRELLQHSHWMTVWVTDLLMRLGVPEESIIWNVSELGEEVDIIVDFLGQLWIFELKDREFGAGDAHPFNYRQVRYGADKAIIVSADKVSKDAKRIFDELARDDYFERRAKIVYIEGLQSAESKLRDEITDAAIQYAQQRLAPLGDLTGYDLGSVLMAKYGALTKGSR